MKQAIAPNSVCKAVSVFLREDRTKSLHHIISSAAALLHWHRHATSKEEAK